MSSNSTSVEAASGLYSGYEAWKGWDDLFSYTPYKADYFAGETRGLAIAGAEVLEIGFGSGDFLQWAIACWINRVAPTAMVMCPCVDGLSHNEAEEISKEWAGAGADVLFHAVVETAEIVE